jgi:hypothetical protein
VGRQQESDEASEGSRSLWGGTSEEGGKDWARYLIHAGFPSAKRRGTQCHPTSSAYPYHEVGHPVPIPSIEVSVLRN